MDRKRWAFPLVGVAAARTGERDAVALAGVAPIPWLLDGDELDERNAAARERPTRSTSPGRSSGGLLAAVATQ